MFVSPLVQKVQVVAENEVDPVSGLIELLSRPSPSCLHRRLFSWLLTRDFEVKIAILVKGNSPEVRRECRAGECADSGSTEVLLFAES